MTQLVRYDTMCRAIAEAHEIDEVKDIRDKALALEQYARQAMNTDAERKATEIRLRAERRAGSMMSEMERAPHGPGRGKKESHAETSFSRSREEAGISKQQASRWQKLAQVDEEQFEQALADPAAKPSTTGIIKKANGGTEKMNPCALWLWGRLRDFERDRIASHDPEMLFSEMTESMQSDVKRIAPTMIDFLVELTGDEA